MGRKLFRYNASPPCQTVIFVGSCLGIDFELINVNPIAGETREPHFLKYNPQHVIPMLIDEDGFVVWESRTIARYLVQKYGNSSLYPEDLKERSEADRILDFDAGTLSVNFAKYIQTDWNSCDENVKLKLNDALSVLEMILERNKTGWLAANQFTIADIAVFVPVNLLANVEGYDFTEYPNLIIWIQRVINQIPDYETISDTLINATKKAINRLRKKTNADE